MLLMEVAYLMYLLYAKGCIHNSGNDIDNRPTDIHIDTHTSNFRGKKDSNACHAVVMIKVVGLPQ